MKRLSKMAGATLLEIMLVLAIAAMIIVMSIRYYQTATQSQQANGVMETVLAIAAAADNLAAGTGTYSTASTIAITSIVGSTAMTNPWGATLSVTAGSTSYVVKYGKMPLAVCNSVLGKLASGSSGSHFTGASCTPTGITYTYNSLAT